MRPESGRSRPAMMRRIVVLPAPEGAKSAVHGASKVNLMSRSSGPARCWMEISWTVVRPATWLGKLPPRAARVDEGQAGDCEGYQQECGAIGGIVAAVLHLVVERDREGLGDAGDVAAEHEDYAELAYRVQEHQDRG